jgi:hypothetical protein
VKALRVQGHWCHCRATLESAEHRGVSGGWLARYAVRQGDRHEMVVAAAAPRGSPAGAAPRGRHPHSRADRTWPYPVAGRVECSARCPAGVELDAAAGDRAAAGPGAAMGPLVVPDAADRPLRPCLDVVARGLGCGAAGYAGAPWRRR